MKLRRRPVRREIAAQQATRLGEQAGRAGGVAAASRHGDCQGSCGKGLPMIDLDPRTGARVLIDVQNGILAMDMAPRSGPQVLAAAQALAARCRAAA
jgi:hypothetical protein